jgi:class 3 adenylate cyclase
VSSPPTGTVTFLFTDIEGSTRLWEQDSSAMQVALARHDEVLRSAIESNGGHVFKTVGMPSAVPFQLPLMP